jgi:hypothetical protein
LSAKTFVMANLEYPVFVPIDTSVSGSGEGGGRVTAGGFSRCTAIAGSHFRRRRWCWHWRINDAGQVERSRDGTAWQTVMPGERATMHVVWVSGSGGWVGGEGLRLYRSADDGATWQRVLLPTKNRGGHAVRHIRFEGDRVGTAEADDGTRWRTVDGGQSWK